MSALAAALLAGCAALVGTFTAAPASADAVCSTADLPVLAGLLPMTVHGQYCAPAGTPSTTVQLLLHGATYNSAYWDLPYQPGQYSYQRDMAAHGLATFAVDELGVGQSSRPLSTLILGVFQASAMHQVVGDLRAGLVGGTHFDKVVLVGHSAGSAISIVEASTYHDVDGVILTGMSHLPNVPVVGADVALGLQPVTLDPQLSLRGGDPGYLTTRPGARGTMYYSPGDLDPGTVAADETYAKDQVSLTSLVDIISLGLVSPVSLSITAPVLLVDGTNDTGFCGLLRDCSSADALRAGEAPYFGPAADLHVYVLPGSGHAVALATNAPLYRDVSRDWLAQHGL
ncbi:alpha/beta fold hydrolase [Solihabitans fulvus]|nr:alpha/beta fold hydrolase [Solihabitans fulvus]